MIIILSVVRAVLVVWIVSAIFLLLDGLGMARGELLDAGLSQAAGAACGLALLVWAWRAAT